MAADCETKSIDLDHDFLYIGCYHVHGSLLPGIVHPKSWYSFHHPTESWSGYCSEGVQPVLKAVYHSGHHNRHPQISSTPVRHVPLDHCDVNILVTSKLLSSWLLLLLINFSICCQYDYERFIRQSENYCDYVGYNDNMSNMHASWHNVVFTCSGWMDRYMENWENKLWTILMLNTHRSVVNCAFDNVSNAIELTVSGVVTFSAYHRICIVFVL